MLSGTDDYQGMLLARRFRAMSFFSARKGGTARSMRFPLLPHDPSPSLSSTIHDNHHHTTPSTNASCDAAPPPDMICELREDYQACHCVLYVAR